VGYAGSRHAVHDFRPVSVVVKRMLGVTPVEPVDVLELESALGRALCLGLSPPAYDMYMYNKEGVQKRMTIRAGEYALEHPEYGSGVSTNIFLVPA
jgi:hypothetical protein